MRFQASALHLHVRSQLNIYKQNGLNIVTCSITGMLASPVFAPSLTFQLSVSMRVRAARDPRLSTPACVLSRVSIVETSSVFFNRVFAMFGRINVQACCGLNNANKHNLTTCPESALCRPRSGRSPRVLRHSLHASQSTRWTRDVEFCASQFFTERPRPQRHGCKQNLLNLKLCLRVAVGADKRRMPNARRKA